MWALYLIKSENTKREKYEEFRSIVEAFRTGNQLVKENTCSRYRVEKASDTNEA